MVAEQIAARGVEDEQVLKAMRTVPRHRFVDEMFKDSAYADHPLSIGRGQTISQPYIVAYMTEALGVDENDKVLEVGTGSGYQAAVLAEIVDQVYTIEIVKPLALRARRILQNLGYKNISFRIGDGYRGWPKAAPFDGIMVTAAPDHVPRPLLEQLAVGGRLVMPVGNALVRITRTKSGYKKQRLLGVRFVPMTGEAQNPRKPAR
jgi:protein-L-isoaspartate(D-aspartate) O-methyltransferase